MLFRANLGQQPCSGHVPIVKLDPSMSVHMSQADIMAICTGAASKCPDAASQSNQQDRKEVNVLLPQVICTCKASMPITLMLPTGQLCHISAQAWRYNGRVSHLEGLVCIEV